MYDALAGDDGLTLDPLQFLDQHVQRVRQHHAAAHGQPFRNDDAFAGG